MDTKLTHRAIVATARAEIKRLKRPAGMRSDLWLTTQQLLTVLAGYLPEVWPSQRTLAAKLGCSPMAVHRRVSTAARHGLITTTIHHNPGWLDGKQYQLVCLSEGLKATCVRYASRNGSSNGSVTQEVLPSTKEVKQRSPSVIVDGSGVALAVQRSKEAGVPRWEPEESDPDPIGADPTTPLATKKVKAPDPAGSLVATLALRQDLVGPRANHSRQFRGCTRASDRRKAIGYIRSVMLVQVSDEMVARAYLDAFVSAVASGEVELLSEEQKSIGGNSARAVHRVVGPAACG